MKTEPKKIGYRYWHYKSGAFFDAVIEQEAKDKAIRGTWFAFAKRFGGVPAVVRSEYCSGIIAKTAPENWKESGFAVNGSPVYVPHGVKAKAIKAEFLALQKCTDIAEKWGFEEAIKDGRLLCWPRSGIFGKAPDQIVFAHAYQSAESTHSPPSGGTELLPWEWEKWLYETSESSFVTLCKKRIELVGTMFAGV